MYFAQGSFFQFFFEERIGFVSPFLFSSLLLLESFFFPGKNNFLIWKTKLLFRSGRGGRITSVLFQLLLGIQSKVEKKLRSSYRISVLDLIYSFSQISPQNSAAIALFAIRSVVFSQYHILMLLSRTVSEKSYYFFCQRKKVHLFVFPYMVILQSDADSWKELQLCAVNAIARLLPGMQISFHIGKTLTLLSSSDFLGDECYFADLSVGIVFAEKEEPRSAIDPKRLRSLQEFYLARFCHDKGK